jgi:uncharacterized protein with HEPN domain
MRPEKLLLADMLEAIREVRSFTADVTYEQFVRDTKTRSAVLFQLLVVGEAAARLPIDLRQRHPEIEWVPIIGFRNRIVHGYFALDWTIVWHAATADARLLELAIEDITAAEFPDASSQ